MAGGVERRRAVLGAAGLLAGSAEILDFLLPLWAGRDLGASESAIGALVATEVAVSVAARPVAGWLVDTRVRTRVALVGAALYGLSAFGYAVATALPLAFVAAVVGGVGGALFWIALAALVGEWLSEDSGAFAGLFSAEATGAWAFWIPAMVFLPAVGVGGIFVGLGVACLVATVALALVPPVPAPPRVHESSMREHAARLAPLLWVLILSGAAEAGAGLLVLLNLEAQGLEIWQIALVFLPGGIALTVFPRHLHALVEIWGRRRVYLLASLASALTAGGLAVGPGPILMAILWVGTGVAWAAVAPIHQSVVTELSGDRVGRGMSLSVNAGLVGAALGALGAGVAYDWGTWPLACLACAAAIVVVGVLGPRALTTLGVRDRPSTEADPRVGSG